MWKTIKVILLLFVLVFEENKIMSYADATRGGSRSSTGNVPRSNSYGKFFNEKLLICRKEGFTCEDVVDAMPKNGIDHEITGFQTLAFGRNIGMEIAEEHVVNKLLTEGLVIEDRTVFFERDKKRDITKVYVHQLPLGIHHLEVQRALEKYGRILRVLPNKNTYRGKQTVNGDWCVHFSVIAKAIPYYVTVCGWNAYITYRGQAKTCRICHNIGHLAKDCPTGGNRDQPENMDVPDQESQKEPESENTAETTSNDSALEKVTIEDCLIPTSVEPGVQQDVQDPKT